MREMIAVLAFTVLLGCNTAENDSSKTGDSLTTTSGQNVSYAYPILYSSQFEMGDAKKAETVVTLWKDFDNNTLNNSKGVFADSITMELPGTSINGTRDSMVAQMQGYRDGFTSIKSSVDAVFATRSTDKDQDWVCIWGRETKTDKKGKTDSTRLHEIWRFRKDGKIDYMAQFIQPLGPASTNK